MRGRSIIKESCSPSVCAFCAHRLGRARQPSHVQRRFLQSSRPASRPPGEGAAIREENEPSNARLGPAWGSPGIGRGKQKGKGKTGSWGLGASLGSIDAGLGGVKPANSTAESPSSQPIGDLLPHEQRARELLKKVAPAAPSPLPVQDLLPHERRARDLITKQSANAQQRPLSIHTGAGPESTRDARFSFTPRSHNEIRDTARRAMQTRRAREVWEDNSSGRGDGASGNTYRVRKMGFVMGQGERTDSYSSNQDSTNWTQVQKRHEPISTEQRLDSEDPIRPRYTPFEEGRAQRVKESRWAQYTPLFGPNKSRSLFGSNPGGREPHPAAIFSKPIGSQKSPDPLSQVSPANGTGTEKSEEEVATEGVSGQVFRELMEEEKGQAEIGKAAHKKADSEKPKEEEEEVAEYERPSRRKKKSRNTEPEPSYSKLPKGKERDKAKRRQNFVVEEDDEAAESARLEQLERAELKRQRKLEKAAKKPVPIMLPEYISVSNLAIALRVRQEDFIRKMQDLGFEDFHHDFILNSENAGLIAMEYNFEPIIDRGDSDDLKAAEIPKDTLAFPPRPPVVTIMGHVDHGKTTILDYLRKSSVAAGEHGGITQHIGAFSVPMPSGKTITFLDTPGHAAFLSMRQRGANVTDIVILVVAADDSVKPQTIEAINHAKAAQVPIIVAINKIDKPESDIEKVKLDLARHGVDVEDFGGDTQVVCVSGKTGQGMDELEEAAVALSDIIDMRADRECSAEGWVIEASIKSVGKCATVLVRQGTMRPGDFIVAGNTWARIRCLRNEAGIDIEEAGPGTPVEIDGWREQPLAGDEVLQAPSEAKAKSVVDYRLEKMERDKLAEDMEAINENRKAEFDKREREKLEAKAAEEGVYLELPEQKVGGAKDVYFIVKGDVSGSVEAVLDSIATLGNKEVQPMVLRSGVGQLSEFDIEHAAAAKGHVINFNTDVEPHIARAAEQAKVTIIDHKIIYRLVDDVKAELSKYLPPLVTQRVLGEAEISQVFSITVKGRQVKNVAGCKVRNGTIGKNSKVRVMRNGEKVYDGNILSLKNGKRDVMDMKKGSECGMAFENWYDFVAGDLVQTYEENEEKRYL
ncbi:hypothetical protein HYFRA_00009663 [Hymenoscyphus fraxineus]|uniref:Translation initiation factor IF-2, mitochondrial n=1 Tax=Hymenoscyphus fraxineus TaxID=746836 RepID=A0A9N9KW27_9HELO|nr:hypothetical protein HYFRA_00009663 [Hymenoscyphus fraxineus]